mgnify:CR=1 FL=1
MKSLTQPGVLATLVAATLFGAGTPLAKLLLAQTSPWLLAALLYLGSGVGLFVLRLLRRAPSVQLPPGEWKWLAGAVLAGLQNVIAMIEAERTCIDIAQQLHAVERAISAAKKLVIHDHLDHCLEEVAGTSSVATRASIAEFKDITKYL